MNAINIPLDPEIKSLVISGDSEMINEFLKEFQQDVNKQISRSGLLSGSSSRLSSVNNNI